jgi:hypothetical protein
MPVRIIDEHFPLVIGLINGDVTEEDIDQMYDSYNDIHARGERFFLAQETRRVKLPSAVIRKRLGQLNKDFGPLITSNVVGIHVVVANRVVAGALRAVFWFSKEFAPTKTSASALEMFADAEKRGGEGGLVFPQSAKGFCARLDASVSVGDSFEPYL